MKSKKIYLIRHGQTDYNLKKIVQGSGIDAPLNETGRKQAASFYRTFQNIPFDKVYTSTLQRSIQSVEKFIEKGIPHQTLSGLNEINWGTREGMEITPEEDAYYHDVIHQWQTGNITLRIEGGESPQDVYNRQKEALEVILSNSDEENVLICMHGRAMRVLLCQMLNYPLQCMDLFSHSNLCMYKLVYTGEMFLIESFNDVKHLNGYYS
ncbi:histidine phosphatase family protein [Fulvivirga sp. 29W222]|uniref:Histidine phosphatase family protein n=1 Tax=Fulvivirga marina TaxID=2494733 RepID=A0A937FTW1_9BACT|nr:histidine phosphatase family protein [Fulvivirga marina]MBL6445915.1 histidine phosphatase family protein [Fulvivirga marina]